MFLLQLLLRLLIWGTGAIAQQLRDHTALSKELKLLDPQSGGSQPPVTLVPGFSQPLASKGPALTCTQPHTYTYLKHFK